jgi:uncharacterized membrane protein YcaP (DUF421 family)
MFDVNGFFRTMIVVFMIVCFLALLGQLTMYIIVKLDEAVVYILGSIFGRDRNYDFVLGYAIYVSLICCATYFYWHHILVPLYDCINLLFN